MEPAQIASVAAYVDSVRLSAKCAHTNQCPFLTSPCICPPCLIWRVAEQQMRTMPLPAEVIDGDPDARRRWNKGRQQLEAWHRDCVATGKRTNQEPKIRIIPIMDTEWFCCDVVYVMRPPGAPDPEKTARDRIIAKMADHQ